MSLIHQLLAQYWGYTQFRPLQEEIIRSVMEGKDTLALLPTGGGKSVCFQVPGLAMDGICLVVSPLIALMKDQEEQLKSKGIRAVALVSGMKKNEVALALENCRQGGFKFLYVSPERLASRSFLSALLELPVNLIAVDEAHCISQWGYDFRPPYLEIANLRDHFPRVPVLALTASATPEVSVDICEKLRFRRDNRKFSKSFMRANLSYIVRHAEDKTSHLLKVLKNVPGTSVVYVRNRKKTAEIAAALIRNGITADYYHAGLEHQARIEKQDNWMKGRTRVIVATNAFGMGIDKPDVRTVIHMDLPDDLESYYQEAGRGGRDGKNSYAVVLYNQSDLDAMEQRAAMAFPERQTIRTTYQALGNFLQLPVGAGEGVTWAFELTEFCSRYKFDILPTFQCLKLIEMAGYISLSDSFYLPARIRIGIPPMELYRFQVEQAAYDPIIKVFLRSYGGLFDDYVKFSLQMVAGRLKMQPAELEKKLNQLTAMGILDYLPASDTPRLTFNEARVATADLYIPKSLLEERKTRFTLRQKAFRDFITGNNTCRSILLLSYFGEKNLVRCGTCDYCRDRNRVELNDMMFDSIQKTIVEHLQHSPLPADELASGLTGFTPAHVEQVIRWMSDHGIIGTDLLGRLYMTET